ncbi:MAG: hypothetical protein WCL50_18435, partial [Spirochaetota bacterium]
PFKGKAVIGNIEEDFHGLGRRLVASFLRTSGWEVHDLGNDVAAERTPRRARCAAIWRAPRQRAARSPGAGARFCYGARPP